MGAQTQTSTTKNSADENFYTITSCLIYYCNTEYIKFVVDIVAGYHVTFMIHTASK
jgi:hypothetical protein